MGEVGGDLDQVTAIWRASRTATQQGDVEGGGFEMKIRTSTQRGEYSVVILCLHVLGPGWAPGALAFENTGWVWAHCSAAYGIGPVAAPYIQSFSQYYCLVIPNELIRAAYGHLRLIWKPSFKTGNMF